MPRPPAILRIVKHFRRIVALAAGLACVLANPAARGQHLPPREPVALQINQTTTVGTSVFVLGDIPELGGNDLRRAVKLDPSGYPSWRVGVSIPEGRTYTYRYYLRQDAPGRTSDPTNGTPIGSVQSASTSPAPATPASKTLFFHSSMPISGGASVWYRLGARSGGGVGAFTRAGMEVFGPARTAAETRWFAWKLPGVRAGQEIEFYFTNAAGGSRVPASGSFSTFLDGALVQDGQVYSYVPAVSVGATRRDYTPSNPPSVFSTNLNETRRYRVFLPRGYDQHPGRRYPVLYAHDGQNVFEQGAFGSWNGATTIQSLQQAGHMREVIVVAVDNGPNRLTDYLPPDDATFGVGRADRYARFIANELKPLIDAQYRTLTGPETTGALGSSMGGVVSLYMGWDFSATFRRVGLFSGAWWSTPNFLNRVRPAGTTRPLRIYMDSGDSGQSNDDYWNTYNLRDAFVGGAAPRFRIEDTLRHVVGFGQQHNEAAWAARLPDALRFMYPPGDEPNQLLRELFNPTWDTDGNGRLDIEDLHAQHAQPRDLNLDGVTDAADTLALENFLRRN